MKKRWKPAVALAVIVLVLAGCGEEKASKGEPLKFGGAGKTVDETQIDKAPAVDSTNLFYLEEYRISDYYGDGKKYGLYAPKNGSNEDGFFYYWEHGVSFTASVHKCDDSETAAEALQAYLQEKVDKETDEWENLYKYSDIEVGEILEKGNDRYLFMSATDKDIFDMSYRREKLMYMSVRDGGACVLWDMEISEIDQDEDTTPLIEEVARCYGLNLDVLVMEDGIWADQDGKVMMSSADLYMPKEGEPVLEKVEGYEYLGMMEMGFSADRENITCPVLAPMGRDTNAYETEVSAAMHGVNVRITGDYTGASQNYQKLAQEGADNAFRDRCDPEEENRNVRVSELIPMKGQEAGVYYVVAYDKKESDSDEYYKRADVSFCIQVKEKYLLVGKIYLSSNLYDKATNSVIRELETAYGLDLSEWYADEGAQ